MTERASVRAFRRLEAENGMGVLVVQEGDGVRPCSDLEVEMYETLCWLRMAMGWAVFREDSGVWASNEMRDINAKINEAIGG